MIKIFYTKLENQLCQHLFYSYLKLLPAKMQDRILKFKRWQDAQASLLGKIILIKALERLGINRQLSELKYAYCGKPYFENGIEFNISHSGSYIVCGLSDDAKIGVDIEEIRPIIVSDFSGIFQIEEWNSIMSSEYGECQMFFHYWTAKESIIKADGRGLNIPLKNILIENNTAIFHDRRWYLKNISLFHDCMFHIASDSVLRDVSLIELDLSYCPLSIGGKNCDEIIS